MPKFYNNIKYSVLLKTGDFNIFLHENREIILFFVEVILKLLINLFFLFFYTKNFLSPQFLLLDVIKDLDFFNIKDTEIIFDIVCKMDSGQKMAEGGKVAAPTQLPPVAEVEGAVTADDLQHQAFLKRQST